MKLKKVDYSNFHLSKLNDKEFSHVKLLLYWPLYGLMFWFLELGLTLSYTSIYSPIDDLIPFCEFFVIPYYFWFVFLIGIQVYSFFYDVPTFRNYMNFTMLTYTLTLIIYIIFPNQQELRPINFPRNNFFTDIVRGLYSYDTNTNVCPSLHVIGSFAVYFAARKSKLFSGFWWRLAFFIATILISISTVFLKQHSIIDVFWGVVMSFVCYPIIYMPEKFKLKKLQTKKAE